MNNTTMRRFLSLLTASVLAVGFSAQAQAAGTAAGTTISNSASVDYQVGGVDQPTETSGATTFKVDQKVDLSVSTDESAVVSVTPGTNDNVLTFTLTNSGNDTFDFNVAATALLDGSGKFGGTDNIDADTVNVFVESGATAGYQSGEDTATSVNDLAADGTKKIYIVADFNTGYSDGDVASYHLVATARKASDGSALTADSDGDTAGTVETEFADGSGSNDSSNDAKHSDFADYQIATASLTVSKSSSVVSDPVNGGTNPIAIPGAVVEYTITVSNGAGADQATNVTVTDDLSTEIGNGTIAFKTDGYGAGNGIEVTAPNINSGSAQALTNASDGDEGDYNVTTANTITVSGITLNGGESATVKFQVTVQ